MERMDLGNGCAASTVERTLDNEKETLLVLSYMSREICRVKIGRMTEDAMRLLAHYMALAYLSGRRDGGMEMMRAVNKTLRETERDLPFQ